jgi:hypothetical protein
VNEEIPVEVSRSLWLEIAPDKRVWAVGLIGLSFQNSLSTHESQFRVDVTEEFDRIARLRRDKPHEYGEFIPARDIGGK